MSAPWRFAVRQNGLTFRRLCVHYRKKTTTSNLSTATYKPNDQNDGSDKDDIKVDIANDEKESYLIPDPEGPEFWKPVVKVDEGQVTEKYMPAERVRFQEHLGPAGVITTFEKTDDHYWGSERRKLADRRRFDLWHENTDELRTNDKKIGDMGSQKRQKSSVRPLDLDLSYYKTVFKKSDTTSYQDEERATQKQNYIEQQYFSDISDSSSKQQNLQQKQHRQRTPTETEPFMSNVQHSNKLYKDDTGNFQEQQAESKLVRSSYSTEENGKDTSYQSNFIDDQYFGNLDHLQNVEEKDSGEKGKGNQIISNSASQLKDVERDVGTMNYFDQQMFENSVSELPNLSQDYVDNLNGKFPFENTFSSVDQHVVKDTGIDYVEHVKHNRKTKDENIQLTENIIKKKAHNAEDERMKAEEQRHRRAKEKRVNEILQGEMALAQSEEKAIMGDRMAKWRQIQKDARKGGEDERPTEESAAKQLSEKIRAEQGHKGECSHLNIVDICCNESLDIFAFTTYMIKSSSY